mgnify:CR=1 FL=1
MRFAAAGFAAGFLPEAGRKSRPTFGGKGAAETGGVVAFGDSLTDGNISTIDAYCRWPDQLARRLAILAQGRAEVVETWLAGTVRPADSGRGRRPLMAASVRMRNAMTLFSSVDDVLCHRVRLVLAAKGVTYDLVPVDPQNPPPDLIDLNPYHSVPTLVERDQVLYAASVVSEYLDERYPHPPLMPVDPLSRARLRLAMLRIELDWVPQVQAIHFGGKQKADGGRKRLKELLTASIPLFKASKFFLNPEMSLADCAMAPIIWRLPALDVPLPKDGKVIEEYGNRIFRNPGFARSLTPQEKNLRELPD